MTIDHEVLQTVVQNDLGFNSIDEFARQQALATFQQKLGETESAIRRYEMKYGMSLADFQTRIVNQPDEVVKRFGIIEKEDDLMDWEFQDHALPYFRQRLEQLSA